MILLYPVVVLVPNVVGLRFNWKKIETNEYVENTRRNYNDRMVIMYLGFVKISKKNKAWIEPI